MGHRRLNKKLVLQALNETKGAVYLAAKSLDCSYQAIYDYINKYPDIAELKQRFDEEVNDIAELALRKSVTNGEPWAVKYQLSTKGKGRGYVERQEVTGADGKPMSIKWVDVEGDGD